MHNMQFGVYEMQGFLVAVKFNIFGNPITFCMPQQGFFLYPAFAGRCIYTALLFFISAVFLGAAAAKAQAQPLLPDSFKKMLDTMPENRQYAVYLQAGDAYYATYSLEGYKKALDCYVHLLHLAEKYHYKNLVMDAYDCIGGVYDAMGDEPAKIYQYYKPVFDYYYQIKFLRGILQKSFCMASTCIRLKDSAAVRYYVCILDSAARTLKDRDDRNENQLLVCFTLLQNNDVKEAMRYFNRLDKSTPFKDGNFAYGKMYAMCASRWYFENGNYAKAIESYTNELRNNTSDSGLIMEQLAKACAAAGQPARAYQWMVLLNNYNNRKFKEAVQRDVTVGLLKTDNALLEKQKQLLAAKQAAKNRENKMLVAGLCLLAAFTTTALYFWQVNRRSKIKLAGLYKEKETLLAEIHHRVKNNLQMVHSLLELQEGQTQNPGVQKSLREAKSKVQSIALLHENLYKTDAISAPADVYFTQLVDYLLENFDKTKKASVEYNIGPVQLNSAKLLPLALMVNEMVLNSLKYATGHGNHVTVNLAIEKKAGESKVSVRYNDNGPGLPQHFDLQKNTSLGMNLIFMLARQLKAEIVLNKNPLEYSLVFEI